MHINSFNRAVRVAFAKTGLQRHGNRVSHFILALRYRAFIGCLA